MDYRLGWGWDETGHRQQEEEWKIGRERDSHLLLSKP